MSSDSASGAQDLVDDDESEASGDVGSAPRPGPSSAYPYCEWNGGDFEPFCPPTHGGHGFMNWYVDGASLSYCNGDDCNACLCYASCGGAEPPDPSRCPMPDSGTASPECIDPASTCFLICDHGESCPDGMTCVHAPEIDRSVCAWVE